MAIVSDIEIRLRADIARLQNDMTGARRSVDNGFAGMSKTVKDFQKLVAGLGLGIGIKEFATQLVDAQREFDKLNSALITATGSVDNAKQAFAALQKFAASTPYDLKQTTEAFLKLRNLGLTPSERALRSYGNTAGALGKNLNQMVEAVADATTGEFERLKEFGIKAKQNGDQVSLTFQGATKTIANNAKTIEEYLLKLGETKFAGGMELQAKTLDGAISNLGDTWQSTLRSFNDSGFGEGTKTAVQGLTEALTNLQYIIKAIGGAGKETSQDLNGVSIISKGLTTVFETVAALGVNVWYVIEQIGKEIGGLAAQAVAVLSGDFSGAAAIGKAMKQDAEAARKAVDERTAAILNASEVRKKVEAEDAKDTTDKLARYKVVSGAQNQATQAALDFYKKTRDASIDQLAQLEAERDGQTELTSEEKKRIDVLNDLERAGKTLSKQQKDDIRGFQDAIVLSAKYNKSLAEQRELRSAMLQDARAQVLAAEQQTNFLRDQVAYYGLAEDAVLALKAAEMERQLQNEALDPIERGRLEGLLDETREQIKLQKQLTQMKADTAFWTNLEDAAHQTFLSIQDGNSNLWDRMKATAKNVFFEWLYQMTVKKWIVQVGLDVGGVGAVSGIAGAAAQTAGSSALGTAGSLAGIASAVSGLGGALAGGAGWLTGATTFGGALTAGTSLLGTGTLAGGIAGAGVLAGAIAPVVVGLLGASKLWSSAFGMGAKEIKSTSIQGTLTPDTATLNAVSTWFQKGGWFRSNKSGTDTTALDATQTAAFSSTYKAILAVSKTLGDTIGADTAALSTRVQQLNIDLTGITDATKQQEAITKFFAGVADTISTELVPNLAQFQADGEALSTTLQRIVSDYAALDTALAGIDKTFGAVGVSSIAAREALIAAAGGLTALQSSLSYFQQNFLTDAERLAQSQKTVSASLTSLGVPQLIGASIEQYKQYAQGLDLTNTEQAKLFAALLELAPTFKTVADAATAAAAAQTAAAEAAQKAADDARASALAANEELLRANVNTMLDKVKAAIEAKQASIKTDFDAIMESIAASIDSVNTRLSALNSLASMLSGARFNSTAAASAAAQVRVAQAQLEAAAAIAKASGKLPSADSLRDAISAVTADNSAQFSSLLDYQRSQARSLLAVSDLAGLTDAQISTAEATLSVLEDQKSAAQLAYDKQLAALEKLQAQAEKDAAIALGSYQELVSIDGGVAGLASAIAALSAGATTSNPGGQGTGYSVNDLYQIVLGRQGEAAGIDYWTKAFGSVVDSNEYAQFVAAAQAEILGRANADGNTTQSALDTLNSQLGNMQAAITRTANATQKLADQFDSASGGGGALLTTPA